MPEAADGKHMDTKDAAPVDSQPQSPITSSPIAGSLSLIYAVVGSLWILFSDRAVRMMSSDPDLLMHLQMFKGWLFVGVTTIMLFLLMRRHVRQISRATATLAESERKYRQFFESNPHPMWVFDRVTLQFLAVNDAAISHYGYDRNEFLSMTIKDIRPAEDIEPLTAVVEKSSAGHRSEGVWRHVTKSGEIILVEISTHDLLYEGRTAELVLAHDVTERLRSQKLLQEQKRILKHIASNDPLEGSLDELISFMEKESGSAICSILILEPESGTLRWGAAPNLPSDYNRFVDGLAVGPCNGSCGTAVFRRERVVVSDIASDPLWEASRETALSYGLRACTSQPIFGADGEVLGTFAFYYRTPRAPSEYDFRLIEASSAIAGIAIERHRSEQSLQESEEKYRLLFEAESDAIVVFDQETHRILEVNNAALALYGYSRAEWLSFRCEDVSAEPTSTREAVEIASEQAFQRIPLRWHRKKDGTIFPVEISAATYMYRGRKLICSAHRDITDRKRSEEMLRNVAEGVSAATGDNFFRLLAEYLARSLNFDYVLLGEITGEGTHVLTLANYARGRFIANIVYDLAHTPCEHVVRGSLCSYPENVRNLFPQDTMLDDLDIESYVGTPLYDSAGNTVGLMAVMDSKPITDRDTAETMLRIFAARASAELERKRWESELRENQELLATVLDSLPVAVWILDAEGNIKRTNPAGLEIWGGVKYVGVDEFGEYRGWWADTGKPLAPEDWGGFRAVRRGETSLDEVVDIETLDGKRKTILHSAVPITTDTGRILGAVVVNQDITERRRLEEQLRHSQKMEAVGTLTGGIAHDFNNILTAIIGYCSILRMKMPSGDPLLVFVDNLAASAERASDLTRSLLAFSRKQILTPQPADLNGIVSSIEKLLVRLIGEHIEIRTALFPDPLIINADRGQIEQILMNLATNARDAMPDGGMLYINTQVVELDEEFRRIHGFGDPGRYACLSVTDTGGGMSDSTRKRIFEPFYTTKEVGKGTGLGLSIVYGIVKQHKGYINVYSEAGAGTGINIYLPLVDAEPKVDESAPTHRMLCGNETLLLAEDNGEVRRLTRLVLEEFGYSVIEAMDGVEAVERFAEYQEGINLLILDVIMPRKNGRDALEDIRKIRPDVPVVFTSGYPIDIISSREIFDEGQVFVPKPVLPHVLLSRIREALDGRGKGEAGNEEMRK